ncbi:MAG TPA: transglycosylase SLT domain-containing protein [Methylomirabilota bacterium]|nr:transglycosylase SLT domain-containing protein [Methylomirabilota bacterium]
MSRHSKALAILAVSIAIAVGGLGLTRHMIAVAGEADAGRLNRSILDYIAQKNPMAPIRAFQRFPETLVAEAQKSNLDHCLVLAQAEVESEFRHDAVGAAGEIGLFQILPSTAAIMEPVVGPFKRPAVVKAVRDGKPARELGDLADPVVSTRFAMAYLRDIMTRKANVRDALTEYNGGPTGRHPHYYRMVMGTYVEILERSELRCRFREVPKPAPTLTTLLTRA